MDKNGIPSAIVLPSCATVSSPFSAREKGGVVHVAADAEITNPVPDSSPNRHSISAPTLRPDPYKVTKVKPRRLAMDGDKDKMRDLP